MAVTRQIMQNAGATFTSGRESVGAVLANPEHVFSFLDVPQDRVGKKKSPGAIFMLRLACKRSPIGMSVVRVEDGKVLWSNLAIQRLLRYSAKELAGMTFSKFTHPDDVEKQRDGYLKIRTGQHVSFDLKKRYIRKDGTSFGAHLVSTLMRRSNNKPMVVMGMIMETE